MAGVMQETPVPAPPRRIAGRAAFTRLLQTRVALIAASLLYAAVLYQSHAGYLNATWDYYGFTHFAFDLRDGLMVALLVVVGALFAPRTLGRPSSVFLLMLYAVVYVPTMVVTGGISPDSMERHASILWALAAAFAIACVAVRLQPMREGVEGGVPSRRFNAILLLAWGVACLVLVALYWSVMQLVGEEQLYAQRAAGASTGVVVGYTQTYFANVINPALIAIGLVKKRKALVLIGLAGCIVMFMINAQRTVLITPLAILGLYLLLTRRSALLRSTSFLVTLLAGAVATINATWQSSSLALALGQYLVFRTLAVPGRTLSQYYEVFSLGGYTWWSHVRGVSAIVTAPAHYANDPKWPALGYFIGDWFYVSPDFNINAHLFSGDGVAAAGPLGIVVTGVALAAWLLVLDRASRGWNRDLVLLLVLPVAITLTNGPLFTILLSFGGLFWTLLFLLHKPRARP